MAEQKDDRWYPQYPRVSVHPLVLKEDGRVLLIKRAKEPQKGKWTVPGGRIELGETVYEACKREVMEECSIEIEIERVFDVGELILKDASGRVSYHFVAIYPIANYKSGEIKADSDAADAGWFTPGDMARLELHSLLPGLLAKAGLA